MFRALPLVSLGHAATTNQHIISFEVSRTNAPFRSAVTVGTDSYVNNTLVGEYSHFATKMQLDLKEDWTTLLERQCELCVSNQTTFKPTSYHKTFTENPHMYHH